MIARKAGAAGLEFANDVDDEEVPPGIGVLFPYVERSYLLCVVSPCISAELIRCLSAILGLLNLKSS
jgi:hypothetical protein